MKSGFVLTAAALLALVALHAALAATEVAVVEYPAPVGYAYLPRIENSTRFDIDGYMSLDGSFKEWPARNARVYITPEPVKMLYGPWGGANVKIMQPELPAGYVVRVNESGYLLVTTVDELIFTSLPLGNVSVGDTAGEIVVVNGPYIQVVGENYTEYTTVWRWLGVPRECISFFDKGPWTGGVVDTVTCRVGRVLYTETYNGVPYATVIEYKGKLVVFTRVATLLDALVVSGLASREFTVVHVRRVQNPSVYAGFEKLPVVDAVNVTANGVCFPPSGSKLVLALLWNPVDEKPSRGWRPKPGEVALFEHDGTYYICTGDLSWLSAWHPPYVQMPNFPWGNPPIVVDGLSLIVSADGRVWSGAHVEIPLNEVQDTGLMVVWGGFVDTYIARVVSPIPLPALLFAALTVATLAGAYLVMRSKEAPRTITIVYDLLPPSAPRAARFTSVSDAVERFLRTYGYCPDDIDMALFGILVAEKGLAPQCAWEREHVMRSVVEFFVKNGWAVLRATRRLAIAYSSVGSYTTVYYVYAAGEEPPAVNLVRMLDEVSKVSWSPPSYPRVCGCIVAVEDSELGSYERLASARVEVWASLAKRSDIEALRRVFERKCGKRVIVVSRSTLARIVEAYCG